MPVSLPHGDTPLFLTRFPHSPEAGGVSLERLANIDLDAAFDPEAHEKLLEAAFDDSYYDETEDVGPDGKPVKPKFDDDEDLDVDFGGAGEDGEAAVEAEASDGETAPAKPAKKEKKKKAAAKQANGGDHEEPDVAAAAAQVTMDAEAALSNRQV